MSQISIGVKHYRPPERAQKQKNSTSEIALSPIEKYFQKKTQAKQ
jgi:hypothetical protein